MPTKTFRIFNNNKPWFTPNLRQLRQAKEEAYRNGDKPLFKALRNSLTKEIRAAKKQYSEKLKNQFSANDTTALWRGLQDITNYKRPPPPAEASNGLADDLNAFYCSGLVFIEDMHGCIIILHMDTAAGAARSVYAII